MKKPVFYTEAAYLAGLVLLALGTAMMTTADFGVSMVVAPAYLLHLFVSQFWGAFSFGMAEYTLQAALLAAMMLVLRRARVQWLFSFVTAFCYGWILDGFMALVGLFSWGNVAARLALYVAGFFVTAFAVSCMFHTYLAPAVYELFVREVSRAKGKNITRFKTVYDLLSLAVGTAMSLVFFRRIVGVGLGTLAVAALNGKTIGLFSGLLERKFEFRDRFPALHRE